MLAFFELLYSKLPRGKGANRLSRSLTRSGPLMYNPIMTLSMVPLPFLFHGRAFGV